MRAAMILIGLGLVLGLPTNVQAVDPDVKCYADKVKETAKYSACRLKAESKAIKKAETPDFSKCDSKYSQKWQKAESKAGGACLTNGDEALIQARITDDADDIVTLLGGGSVPGCQQLQLPATGQVTCWDSGGSVVACGGTGHDGEIQAGATLAYVDNGDGTITDLNTGLMWEKKSDDGSIHDKDTFYSWDDAFAVHVAGLNSSTFAGHTDWRLPNVKELQSIVDYEAVNPSVDPVFNSGCVAACTVTTCSCTVSSFYWSSTSNPLVPTLAGTPHFGNVFVDFDQKDDDHFVRAVRGAP